MTTLTTRPDIHRPGHTVLKTPQVAISIKVFGGYKVTNMVRAILAGLGKGLR